jgi:hypothetical protein
MVKKSLLAGVELNPVRIKKISGEQPGKNN